MWTRLDSFTNVKSRNDGKPIQRVTMQYSTLRDLHALVLKDKYSRIPVYDGTVDNITGSIDSLIHPFLCVFVFLSGAGMVHILYRAHFLTVSLPLACSCTYSSSMH